MHARPTGWVITSVHSLILAINWWTISEATQNPGHVQTQPIDPIMFVSLSFVGVPNEEHAIKLCALDQLVEQLEPLVVCFHALVAMQLRHLVGKAPMHEVIGYQQTLHPFCWKPLSVIVIQCAPLALSKLWKMLKLYVEVWSQAFVLHTSGHTLYFLM